MGSLRPISLEFGPDIPDHRNALDNEDPQTDPQTPDLGDSIDALLGEIDVTCAHFNNEDDPAKSNQTTACADDGPSDVPVEMVSPEEADEPIDDVGDAALEALDAVSQNAESLLEDTIGALLDEVDDGGEENTAGEDEPAEESSAQAIEEPVEAADEIEGIGEGLAQDLGEIAEELIADTDAQSTPEPETETETSISGLDSQEELDELDELLGSVNEDLVAELQEEAIEHESDQVPDQEPDQELDQEPDQELDQQQAQVAPEKPDEPIDDVVEPATEPVTEPVAQPVAEPVAQPGVDPVIEDLDSALADIGDELLEGDFETAEGELIDSDALDESLDPALLLDQLDIPSALPDVGKADAVEADEAALDVPVEAPPQNKSLDEPGDEAPTSPALADVAAVVPDAVRTDDLQRAPIGERELGEGEDAIESIWQMLARVLKMRGRFAVDLARAHGGPAAAKGVLALSKPVASKPARVRDSIGYLAIWTIFLACVLWIYLVFIRTTPTPVPAQAPTRVVTPGEDLTPIENQMSTQLP